MTRQPHGERRQRKWREASPRPGQAFEAGPHSGEALRQRSPAPRLGPLSSGALTISPGVRGLIFDVDGTLADTMPIHYQAWRQILAEAGIDYPLDMFYELAGMPTRAIVPVVNRRFGVGLDPDVTARRKERLFAGRLREVAPIEPVVALVRRHAGLLPMGIGTGGGRTLISRILDVVGLTGYFEVIVTAEDVASPKPAPDTWLLCAAGMGVPPELCQVFEDGELGLVAARRAGMIATDVRPFLRVPSGQPQGGMREEMP